MSTIVIRPEEFEKAVMKALGQYGDHVTEVMEQETKSIARKTVKAIKGSAPSGGSYAKGWSHKMQKSGPFMLSDITYNRIDYHLTHLLEKPHDTGGGGHYPKNVDYTGTLERIEEKNSQEYMQEVMAKL